jgi:hypothetical protein
MSTDEYEQKLREARRDKLVSLQTQKLQREQESYNAEELRALIAGCFAITVALLKFVFTHPKTVLLVLLFGYGIFQFGAPARGAEFNRWIIVLFTDPKLAGNELLTTLNLSNLDDPTFGSPPANESSTDTIGDGDLKTRPANLPPEVKPKLAVANPTCKKFNWSSPDDIPYLHYYKCPNPSVGN